MVFSLKMSAAGAFVSGTFWGIVLKKAVLIRVVLELLPLRRERNFKPHPLNIILEPLGDF